MAKREERVRASGKVREISSQVFVANTSADQRALRFEQTGIVYRTWDREEKLGPPPWSSKDPKVIAWEHAHGHDVRLKCYAELGCDLVVPELEAEVGRLREVLLRYGFHDRDCKASFQPMGTPWPCTCGWDAVRNELTKENLK